jgi:hypothetical protein
LASTARVADSAIAEMRWETRAADMAGPFFAGSPGGWNVGFDEFYSMLFTGPSGEPVLIYDCPGQHLSGRTSDGPGQAGFTYAKFLRRLVHRC